LRADGLVSKAQALKYYLKKPPGNCAVFLFEENLGI